MQYARDNYDLDPHWHLCAGCDRDGDFVPDADGLCPECAARKAAQQAEEGGEE